MSEVLSREDIYKIAKLANLTISPEEVDSYIIELSAILEYVQQLNDLSTDKIKPTNQITNLSNVWRNDVPIEYEADSKTLLANMLHSERNYLKVNRVIE